MGDLHLAGPSARKLARLYEQIPRHREGVLEVALDFREHVLRPATEDNRAGLRVLAFDEVREVLVADLPDLEEAAPLPDVLFRELIRAIRDGSAASLRDTVVVRLADPANHGNVRLEQEVLRKITHTLLRHDNVRLQLDEIVAELLNLFLLLHQHGLPISLIRDLNVGVGFVLLVLERAIDQDNPGVLDVSAHLVVRHVLVEHDALQHFALLELAAWDLLNARVPLDVDLHLSARQLDHDGPRGLERELRDHRAPARHELRPDARLDEFEHHILFRGVNRDRDLLKDALYEMERLHISVDDHRGMQALLQQW